MTDPAPDLLAGLRDGQWLDRQTFPPLTYAVPGIVPEGMSLLVGPPKAGKSWCVLSLCLAVSSGGRAFGVIPVGDPRPTLYLALEDGDRRLQDRCRTLLAGEPIPPYFTYLTRLLPGTAVAVETITTWLERHGGESPLIVLDTLGKVMPPSMPGESAYGRDYRVGSALKRAVDDYPGAALLINHHDRKAAGEDFVDSVSGTHGLAGAADTILALQRDRQSTEAILAVTGRDVEEAEYGLNFNGSGWQLAGNTPAEAATAAARIKASRGVGDRSGEVVAYVAQHPKGVRAGDVEKAMGADSRRYLARLAEAGKLHRLGRGLYALHVPSVPLSQDDAPTLGQRDRRDTTPKGELRVLRPQVDGQ